MTTFKPEALLFDLGRVLVDVDFGQALHAWAPYSKLSLVELQRRFGPDSQYEQHERGELTDRAYFLHLAEILQLSATPEQIEQGWNAIFPGEITQTIAQVEAMRGKLPCYVFSNTNASHQRTWSSRFPRVVAAFDRIFTSNELGLRKPERAAFDRVCQLIGKPPEAILFFDDAAENVRGACAAGLQAVQVHSPADVAHALRVFGLV